MSHDPSLYPSAVTGKVGFFDRFAGRASEIVSRAPFFAFCLALVGLEREADKKAFAASTGQRRRIELARILATRPRLLLLDEPTAGVDPETEAAVVASLETLRREQRLAIWMVTHQVHAVAGVVDRVIRLADGRLEPERAA